jgi:flagellin-like protein
MVGLGTPRRSLRHGRRAVSPIIAMILLVAIAVVLAAVLYVFVAGMQHGAGSLPLGAELYAGPSHPGTVGTPATNAFCQKGHYCYSIPIDEAGGGIAFDNLNFQVMDSTGHVHVVSQSFAQIAIVSLSNTVLASTKVSRNSPFDVTTWQTLAKSIPLGTPLSDQQTIWVQFGNTKTSPFGQGHSLVIIGVNGFAGSLTVSLP